MFCIKLHIFLKIYLPLIVRSDKAHFYLYGECQVTQTLALSCRRVLI